MDPDAVSDGEWGRSRDGYITVDGGGYRQRGRASHCNQWGRCCEVVQKCVNRSSCRLGSVGWAQALMYSMGSTCLRGRANFGVVCPIGQVVLKAYF